MLHNDPKCCKITICDATREIYKHFLHYRISEERNPYDSLKEIRVFFCHNFIYSPCNRKVSGQSTIPIPPYRSKTKATPFARLDYTFTLMYNNIFRSQHPI